MARQKGAAKGSTKGARAGKGGSAPSRDPVEAALHLAGTIGWKHVTPQAIAGECGVPLAELYRDFPTRSRILDAFARRIDTAMLEKGMADGDSVRDRLFAVIMARFDALQPYRAGVANIIRSSLSDPAPVICGGPPAMMRSAAWMLEAAGVSSNGIIGALRIKVLSALYLDVARVWLRDESADLSATMAALDKRLGRLEKLVNTLNRKGD